MTKISDDKYASAKIAIGNSSRSSSQGDVPKSPRRDDLADELAAFANTDGGVVLCGVSDAGDVQGMSREQMDALERLLVEVCTDNIKPSIRPTILRKEIEEGAPFLLVEVPARLCPT